jgi:hypothetical protein
MSDFIANTSQHADPLSISTITFVPEDVLRQIFAIVVDTMMSTSWDAEPIHPSPALTPLSLSQVCATWRLVAMDCKDLWRTIDLAYPRFAELCMNLSRPWSIHVFCRDPPRSPGNDPDSLEYLAVFERIIQDSARIASLRFSRCTWERHDTNILHSLIDLQPMFLRSQIGGLPWSYIDLPVTEVTEPLQDLRLIGGAVFSKELLCSFRLVTLKIYRDSDYSVTQWRVFFKHHAPTLKHLEFRSWLTRRFRPPIVLPFLDTLSVGNVRSYGAASLYAPRAKCITLIFWSPTLDHDSDHICYGFTRAIRQRFRGKNSVQQPFHVRYNHNASITLSNPEAVIHVELPCTISDFALIYCSLGPGIHETVTRLELNAPDGHGLYTEHRRRRDEKSVGTHDRYYRDMAAHLPNLEEIWLDAICADDFLPWLARAKNQYLCSSLRIIQLTNYGHNKPDVDGVLMYQIMDSFAGNGQPIRLILKNCNVTIDGMLREKGHFATVVNDEVHM